MNQSVMTDSINALDVAPDPRDHGDMTSATGHPLLRHRIDTSKNMARFYAMQTAPTLFGETAVIRNWGRIGTSGQMRLDTFSTAAAAHAALTCLQARKSRRGYRAARR